MARRLALRAAAAPGYVSAMPRTDPIAHLGRHARATDALCREVRALGVSALPRLRALLLDPRAVAGRDDAPSRAAAAAAQVLAEWPGRAAADLLAEALATREPAPGGGILHEALVRRARELRDALLACRGGPRADLALEVLQASGSDPAAPPDPRVTDWIAEVFAADVDRGVALARSWPDPALLPFIHDAFDALYAPAGPLQRRSQRLLEIAGALDACGGDPARIRLLTGRLQVEVREHEAEIARLDARVKHLLFAAGRR